LIFKKEDALLENDWPRECMYECTRVNVIHFTKTKIKNMKEKKRCFAVLAFYWEIIILTILLVSLELI
jgi:hypothetical protein